MVELDPTTNSDCPFLSQVVRPFFQSHGIPYHPAQNNNGSGSDETNGSSEGFTAFFTTTHSSANNTSTDGDKKPKSDNHQESQSPDGTDSSQADETRNRAQRQGEGDTSSTFLERRVRIQEGHHVLQSELNAQQDASHECSTSSESSEQPEAGHATLPRVVTDVSSSNRTETSSSNANSGSGSAENTGSGSNQGSSGSGNDLSGNDAKESSEDLPKGDNSGEGTNDGSDGASSDNRNVAVGLDLHPHRHESAVREGAPKQASGEDRGCLETDDADRERKLLDKKRKRIEMRREYEALQQSESSEISGSEPESLLRPGRPVTLDHILQCSKIPR